MNGPLRLGRGSSSSRAGSTRRRRAVRRRTAPPRARSAVTGETTNLVILDGYRVVYVDQVDGPHSVRMFTELGTTAPAHTTGSGKAILAYRPPEAIAGHLPARTRAPRAPDPATHTTLAPRKDDFARIHRRGYALDGEEHEEGVSCVAAPLFDGDRGPRSRPSASRAPTSRIVHADTGRARPAPVPAQRRRVRGARPPPMPRTAHARTLG